MYAAGGDVNWIQLAVMALVALVGSAGGGAIYMKYHPSKMEKRAAEVIEYKESVDIALTSQAAELVTLRQLAEAQEFHNKRLVERMDECEREKIEAKTEARLCKEHVAAQAQLIATQAMTIVRHEERIESLEHKGDGT